MVWPFGVVGVLSEGNPVAMGCFSIALRVLPVESCTPTQRGVVPVPVARGQEVRPVEVLLACIASDVSGLGDRIALVSGSHDLVRGAHRAVSWVL